MHSATRNTCIPARTVGTCQHTSPDVGKLNKVLASIMVHAPPGSTTSEPEHRTVLPQHVHGHTDTQIHRQTDMRTLFSTATIPLPCNPFLFRCFLPVQPLPAVAAVVVQLFPKTVLEHDCPEVIRHPFHPERTARASVIEQEPRSVSPFVCTDRVSHQLGCVAAESYMRPSMCTDRHVNMQRR